MPGEASEGSLLGDALRGVMSEIVFQCAVVFLPALVAGGVVVVAVCRGRDRNDFEEVPYPWRPEDVRDG